MQAMATKLKNVVVCLFYLIKLMYSFIIQDLVISNKGQYTEDLSSQMPVSK